MAVGANANAYWLISRLNAAWSGEHAVLTPWELGRSFHCPPGWQAPLGSWVVGSMVRRSSAGSIGSAPATALTQATRVAATKAAKRTRIWRSVGRGYWGGPIHVK